MNQSTCVALDCDKIAKAPRGWCWSHYNKWRRHGSPSWVHQQVKCAVDECDSSARVHGMCDKHYRRVKKHGDPSIGARPVYGNMCASEGCTERIHQTGLCSRHYYARWISNGSGRELQAAASSRRRARIARSRIADHNLSWHTLWAEGMRECYLCGGVCDPTDYRQVLNRGGRSQKICGPTYPSLDHVIPLARGGDHSRPNSALACMQCNRSKHTKPKPETSIAR